MSTVYILQLYAYAYSTAQGGGRGSDRGSDRDSIENRGSDSTRGSDGCDLRQSLLQHHQ